MEEDYGIPVDHFDYVYWIYGMGWTTDFEGVPTSSSDRKLSTYLKVVFYCSEIFRNSS